MSGLISLLIYFLLSRSVVNILPLSTLTQLNFENTSFCVFCLWCFSSNKYIASQEFVRKTYTSKVDPLVLRVKCQIFHNNNYQFLMQFNGSVTPVIIFKIQTLLVISIIYKTWEIPQLRLEYLYHYQLTQGMDTVVC